MALRRVGDQMTVLGRRVALAAALFLAVVAISSLFAAKSAMAAEDAEVLPGSGIHYPGGFDSNTVDEVEGAVRSVERPARGPVRFRLETQTERYIVLTTPEWYFDDLGIALSDGMVVRVRGSKSLGKDLSLYIVAQEIKVVGTSMSYACRDDGGFPLWKRGRSGAAKSGGGTGTVGGQAGGSSSGHGTAVGGAGGSRIGGTGGRR